MKSWFDEQGRVEALVREAESWLGTIWCENSEAKGAGVACHLLPTAIYCALGALPADFPRVKGKPNRFARQSVMVPFLDGRPEFERMPLSCGLMPGDLVGLRLYRCVDHLGVILDGGWFIHVLQHKHVDKDLIADPTWWGRLEALWRLKP